MPFFYLTLNRPTGKRIALTTQGSKEYYAAIGDGGHARLSLKRRQAYPTTFCHVSADGLSFGYGAPTPTESSEFLLGHVTPTGELRLRRDAFGTLPLFYAEFQDKIYVSSDFAWLVAQLPAARISYKAFAEALRHDAPMASTFADRISILWPDETLSYTRHGLAISLTKRRDWRVSADTPTASPRSFYEQFEQYLDYFISSRLEGQRFAFEVSGGLDSATLPQYFHRKYGIPVAMAALLHTDHQQEAQRLKLRQLEQTTRSRLHYQRLNPKTDFPLSRMVNQARIWPTYFEKTYLEPTAAYVSQLAGQGIDVLCTGVGGDELFGNVTEAPDDYRSARSVRYGTLCNNVYIEQGVWPVSPLVDISLYTVVQGLPVQYRSNKNILRAYHHANRYIADIYNPVRNETFTPFFTECFTSGVYDDLIHHLAGNSYGARQNLVDLPLLLQTYQRTQHQRYPELDSDCFRIYLWVLAEINAQSIGATSGDRPFG
jgi:hypothetical protein